MAGSFSGHLVDSFLSAQQKARGPFGQNNVSGPAIATHGPLAFAPEMHGTFNGSSMSCVDPIYMDLSPETAQKIATLQAKLDKKLGPEYISQRPGPGGGPKLTYAEGWKIINLANEVFGFNGWSSSVVNLSTDFIDFNEESRRFTVGVTAVVRVMLRDGVFHEDVGYGMLENSKSKGAALDKCKKEAVTDGVKRALRNFGNLLGNCLYDKQYTQEVIKIKVPPPKFDKSQLHRRPEFAENDTNAGPSAHSAPAHTTSSSTSVSAAVPPNGPQQSVPNVQVPQTTHSSTAGSSVPPHMRTTSGTGASTTTSAKSPMGLAGQVPSARPLNMPTASTSATAKSPSTASGQGPAYNQPQLQQSKPVSTSGIVYRQSDIKPAPAQSAAASSSSAAQSNERRVSFAQQPPNNATTSRIAPVTPAAQTRPSPPVAEPKPESFEDESYGLNSEDDDFFASVDLGGLGGPIDFDEGTGAVDGVDESLDDGPSVLGGYLAKRTNDPVRAPQQQYAQQPAAPPHRAAYTSNQPSKPVQGQPVQRPSGTPSAGGFHFPPGMNAQNLKASGQPNPSVGMKRNADAMRELSARRPAQGMGLSHPPSGVSTGMRQPFAPLDISDGGDPKRIKR